MLKKTFRLIDRFFASLEEWSLFLTVGGALVVALANIILRKTSTINIYWSDEVVRKVIYFSTYIGAVAAIRNRSLIRIDALPQIVPVLKKPLTLLSHLAVLLFAGLMIWLGMQMTTMVYQDEYARTATLQIPEWLFLRRSAADGDNDVPAHRDCHGGRLARGRRKLTEKTD